MLNSAAKYCVLGIGYILIVYIYEPSEREPLAKNK